MRFSFPQSDASPGGEVQIEDAEAADGMWVVEFGDGIDMIGEWHPDGDHISSLHPSLPHREKLGHRCSPVAVGLACQATRGIDPFADIRN